MFCYMNSRNSNLWVFTIENPIASRKKGLFALDLMTNPHVIFYIQNHFSNRKSCKIRIHSLEQDERYIKKSSQLSLLLTISSSDFSS